MGKKRDCRGGREKASFSLASELKSWARSLMLLKPYFLRKAKNQWGLCCLLPKAFLLFYFTRD